MSPRRFALHVGSGILVLGLAFGSGCQIGDPIVPFVIQVDTIEAIPDTIQAGSKLILTFRGTIGPDKCWMFDRADFVRTEAAYEVKFWGRRVVRDACPQTPNEMEFIADLFPPFADPFRVTVTQPNGSTLERLIPHQP
jgi:hypothetical protein